jgi:hypothetical protein
LFAVGVLPLWVSRIVIVTILFVFASYLLWPMDSTWTLYYLELEAPLAFLTAVGIYAVVRWIGFETAKRASSRRVGPRGAQLILSIATGAWLVWPLPARVTSYRRAHAEHRRYRAQFQHAVGAVPAAGSIVFVRYAPGHGEERLVDNVPDLNSARTWIVHDRGPENARLCALAPGRRPYIYLERLSGGQYDFRIEPLGMQAMAKGSGKGDPPTR